MSNKNNQIIDLLMDLHEKLDNLRLELDGKVEKLEERVREIEVQQSRIKGYIAAAAGIIGLIQLLLALFKITL